MDLSGQRVPIKGVIDLTGDTPAMQMTMDVTGMGTPTQMRMVDRAMYVGMPGLGGQVLQGRPRRPERTAAALSAATRSATSTPDR